MIVRALSRWVGLACLVAGLLVCGCQSPQSNGCVTVTCVGDVMLGRGVARLCQQRGNSYPFEQVTPHLQAADLTFGNLESPLTDHPTRFPRVNALRGSPAMAPVLANVGFDVMSLANNHAIDYGRTGLRQTMAVLRTAGIAPVGAGSTLAEAQRGVVLTIHELRVGFLAYSHFPYANFVYDPKRESILLLNEEALRITIPPLAQRCDVVVVSFHWGKEGSRQVTAYERNLAHLAVDLGADLIIGHHAHVRGEIERYQDSLIAYCLGNLVFDEQSYGGNEGYILTCRLGRAGVIDYGVLAVQVVDGRPRLDSRKVDELAAYFGIRLLRSFDQISHSYQGYTLVLDGTVAGERVDELRVGIGPKTYERHHFQIGDQVAGLAVSVPDLAQEWATHHLPSPHRQ